MATPTYSVTLHHLAPGASAAGLGYPDEQLPTVTAPQLVELLHALALVASDLTIYEPSAPEIRVKTDREVYVIRTRYRRLCFVGRETLLRGEEHSIAYIVSTITGTTEAVRPLPTKAFDRPPSTSPTPVTSTGTAAGTPEWLKLAVMLVLALGCIGGGLWMLLRPARTLAPKYAVMAVNDSQVLLVRVAGEYQTGNAEGDRRLVISSDGTLRLAKYGPARAIGEEVIRTVRGATQDGKPALVTNDPYVMVLKDPDAIVLYGQTYKRVVR